MTKDVVISVRGLQVMDNESAEDIETVQQGEYFERNGSIFLLYDEYYEGFDEPAVSYTHLDVYKRQGT